MIVISIQGYKMQFERTSVSELKKGDRFIVSKKSEQMYAVETRQATQIKYYEAGQLVRLKNEAVVFLYVESVHIKLKTVLDGQHFSIGVAGDLYKRIASFPFGVYCRSLTTNKIHRFRPNLEIIVQDVNV